MAGTKPRSGGHLEVSDGAERSDARPRRAAPLVCADPHHAPDISDWGARVRRERILAVADAIRGRGSTAAKLGVVLGAYRRALDDVDALRAHGLSMAHQDDFCRELLGALIGPYVAFEAALVDLET